MKNRKARTDKAGENVVDYRHKNVKRLNIPPAGHEARIDLSITDDWPLAQAFVIISAVNPGKS